MMKQKLRMFRPKYLGLSCTWKFAFQGCDAKMTLWHPAGLATKFMVCIAHRQYGDIADSDSIDHMMDHLPEWPLVTPWAHSNIVHITVWVGYRPRTISYITPLILTAKSSLGILQTKAKLGRYLKEECYSEHNKQIRIFYKTFWIFWVIIKIP